MQDATCKIHLPCQRSGTWQSSIVNSEGGMVTISVDKEKWIKAQQRVIWPGNHLDLFDDHTDIVDVPPSIYQDFLFQGFI